MIDLDIIKEIKKKIIPISKGTRTHPHVLSVLSKDGIYLSFIAGFLRCFFPPVVG